MQDSHGLVHAIVRWERRADRDAAPAKRCVRGRLFGR